MHRTNVLVRGGDGFALRNAALQHRISDLRGFRGVALRELLVVLLAKGVSGPRHFITSSKELRAFLLYFYAELSSRQSIVPQHC